MHRLGEGCAVCKRGASPAEVIAPLLDHYRRYERRLPGPRDAARGDRAVRMCQQHLDGLRGLIEASGYGSLIAADGEEADRRLSKELQESAGPDDFDPLMAAQNLILGNAIDAAGTQVLGPAADGSERCPICYLEVPQWVEHAARDAIEQAKTISPGGTPSDAA